MLGRVRRTAPVVAQPPVPAVDKKAIEALFDRWADEEDLLTMTGIAAMADDIGIDACSDVRVLALCWRLGAAKPAEVSRAEWDVGMEKMRLDSLDQLRAFTLALDPAKLDMKTFRDFFKFVFLFSRESTHRTIEKDLVLVLLPIAIGDRSPHTSNFVAFLTGHAATARVTLDQWTSFLEFSDKVALDFSGYDADASAWPLLLDEYVEAAAAARAAAIKK
ncbi:Cullin binding-domain-containing protein [Pelagophyceae sp. CCMP2097]|nr:Cullin binding-domain-containing protein [Pelagophyceae sp. CCMP2097]